MGGWELSRSRDSGGSDSVAARARGVAKAYGTTQALGGVDLELRKGEVHALVGGNGSGKSTLIKILAGIERADAGSLETRGATIDLRRSSPAVAFEVGFHCVHQEQSTFPGLTVAENLSFGRGFETGVLFRWRQRATVRRAQAAMRRFGLAIDPETDVADLHPVDRVMVSVVRALQDQEDAHSDILVLDEPTAALPPREVNALLAALRRYAAQGQTILIVSHRLDEVLAVADRISVFRDGRRVATVGRQEVDQSSLIELMLGPQGVAPGFEESTPTFGDPVIEARGVSGPVVRGASLAIHAGEIVGLAGLADAGASELLGLLFGAETIQDGALLIDGRSVESWTIGAAMDAGLAFVPADRSRQAVFPERSVSENLTAATSSRCWSHGRIDERLELREVAADLSRFYVRCDSPSQPISTLSGGNQQKVVLARWLRRQPRVVLLDEPTQGVDVGARRELWSMIGKAISGGAGALVSSSDMEELAETCDRVMILRDGEIVEEIAGHPFDAARIGGALHAAA